MTVTRTSATGQVVATLRRWRWLILVSGILAVIAFESLEPWLPAEHHWSEIIVYSLAMPGLGWLVLTLILRRAERHVRIEHQLDLLRNFVRQLAEHQTGGRALELLTEYPRRIVPDADVALYGYDHLAARFVRLTRSEGATPAGDDEPTAACASCAAANLGPARLSRCPTSGDRAHYCLTLEHSRLRLGRLALTLPPGRVLSEEQIDTLGLLAPEFSLAVVMATAHDEQVGEARNAARKDERRQLSVTLHNSLAQQLGYLHLSLDRLAESTTQPVAAAGVSQTLATLRDLAGDAYEQMRDLVTHLRAPQLRSLLFLLEGRLRTLSQATGIQTRLDVVGEAHLLTPDQNQQILSLVHECLNNVQKHAQARTVSIRLEWRPEELLLDIGDDGRGFDVQAAAPTGHYGLAMLREQTTELGGHLTVESNPGQGTRLLFAFPLKSTSAQARAAQRAIGSAL